MYYDNMGFDSLEIEGLQFRSFSFDLEALNNDLINSKYKLTYLQYASIIALGAAINCICYFPSSYGIYSNIKYGNPRRPSNQSYETLLNQHFQRQFLKHKLDIDTTQLFMHPELLTTVAERRDRYKYFSLIEESLKIKVSEMIEYVNTLDVEIPSRAAEISKIEKIIYEHGKFIKEFEKKKHVFLRGLLQEKTQKIVKTHILNWKNKKNQVVDPLKEN